MFVLTDGAVSYTTIYRASYYGDFSIQFDAEKIMVEGQYMTLDEAVAV